MKNYCLFAILVLLIIGCEEKNLYQPPEQGDYTSDDIFKQTGCKVNDAPSILYLYDQVLVDKDGNRYLTGSRNVNRTETFWISKYKSGGSLIWEIEQAPTKFNQDYTRGMQPLILSNGNIVVACAILSSDKKGITEMLPTIIDQRTGKPNFVKVKDGYRYESVKAFNDFFICEISQSEVDKHSNQAAYLWATQISNVGKILYSATSINSPDKSSFFLNTNEYISANDISIKKNSLKIEEGYQTWAFKPDLPEHSSYKVLIEKKDESVLVSYHLTMGDGNVKLVRYRLDAEDGTDHKIIYQVQLDKESLEIQAGEDYGLHTTLLPEDTTTPQLLWKSSDEEIATVSESGIITAKKEGKCEITVASADYADVFDTCELTVIRPTNDIVFDENEVTILETDQYTIPYKLYPIGATHEIKWESENPSVATVDAFGKVTALTTGTTRIKGGILEGKRVAECTVTVVSIQKYFTLNTSFMGSTGGGYVSGQAATGILNGSTKTVQLSKFVIYADTNVYSETPINEELKPGDMKAFNNVRLNKIYLPSFVWIYTYNGKEYKATYKFKVD